MIEVKGKYTEAKIFIDILDKGSMGQVMAMTNLRLFEGCKLRFMPDCHAGKGSLVGTTVTFDNKVSPSIIGPDIGCGMTVYELKDRKIELPKFDSVVHRILGTDYKKKCKNNFKSSVDITKLICYNSGDRKGGKGVNVSGCYMSLGSLGGGNHFIELAKSQETGKIYMIIHSGSKLLGSSIEDYYMRKASETCDSSDIPRLYVYCEGELLRDYLHDANIAVEFAELNRQTIAKRILKEMKLGYTDCFSTIHNYIDTENKIIRKGSISAQKNEKVIIPLNSIYGSLICLGKGNEDWNYSAPHGAGRLMSRSEAKSSIGLGEYRKTMEEHGIYSTSVCAGTLDEAPMAYKNPKEIIKNIDDAVEIIDTLRPIYNYKSSSR